MKPVKKPKFKSQIGGRPALDGITMGKLMSGSKPASKPAAIKAPKPSGTNKGPSAQAFAHANANASFKRTASPSAAKGNPGASAPKKNPMASKKNAFGRMPKA